MWNLSKTRPILLLAMAVAVNGTMRAEDGPQRVLVDILTATKPEEVERHLPVEVLEQMRNLGAKERGEFEQRMLAGAFLGMNGVAIKEPDDGRSLIVLEHDGEQTSIRVKRDIEGGGDAMLDLEAGSDEMHEVMVWMHMEEGEWRVTEVSLVRGSGGIMIDANLLDRYQSPVLRENEESAYQTILSIRWAISNFASNFPERGIPGDLAALAREQAAPDDTQDAGDEEAPNEEGISLLPGNLDTKMAHNDFTLDGYVFHYQLESSGESGRYTLTARPVDYGKTGKKSFYADQSGAVRWTCEDREASATDERLGNRGWVE